MAVYLVSYDLRQPGQNYNNLINKITQYQDTKKALYSAYLVNIGQTSQQVYNFVKPALDTNDSLIVTTVTKEHAGQMPQAVWDWLNARL